MFSPFTHVGKIIPLSLISNIFLLYSLKSLGKMNQILQVGMSTFIWRMYLWRNLCTLYFSLIEGCTAGGICVPCMYCHWMMYRWWNLCTLYVLSLMYCWWNLCTLYFTLIEGCTAGGICVPCMYSHWMMYCWWNLCTLYLLSCQVRVTIGDPNLSLTVLRCPCVVDRILKSNYYYYCVTCLFLFSANYLCLLIL